MNSYSHMDAMRTRSMRRRLVWTAALAGAALFGCDREDRDPTPTTEAVLEDPNRYIGKKLALTGEVDRVYSDRAFELEGNEAFFDSSVLVLTRSPVRLGGRMLRDDDKVSVVGAMRDFVVADLERELSWDLNPDLELEWRNKPAFVAESISRLSTDARWSEQELERQGTLVGLVAFYVSPDATALSGEKIEVNGAKVERQLGRGFWIGPDPTRHVFVAPANGAQLPAVSPGAHVDIKGSIHLMPSAHEAAQRWSLDRKARSQIEQEDVYIEAKSVTVSQPDGRTAAGATGDKSKAPAR